MLKNLFYLAIWLIIIAYTPIIYAFETQIDEYQEKLFRNIDRNQIETGILYDKVIPFSNIEKFDGGKDSGIVTLKNWNQMYFEMYQASVEKPSIPPLEGIRKISKTRRIKATNEIIEIAVMNFHYDQIKQDAIEKGLLKVEDGGLKRVKRTSISPFEEKQVFAAVALKEKTYRGDSLTFTLDESLYFSNTGKSLDRFEIDFDNGEGFKPLYFNDQIDINYTEKGVKTVRLKMYDTTGGLLESSFTLDVRSLTTPDPHMTWIVQAEIPYENETAFGTAYVYLSPQNYVLTNPVIVVEGFDIDNTKGWDDLYALLNQENLAETLRGKGYDLIVLDFNDSTDYIQRNSFVFTKLIQIVNSEKAGDNHLAVIGASMGGLVARYGLAYMEQHDMPHETNLFISFDSPQRGANIPLGLQYWLSFFRSESAEANLWISRLSTPAAKQMLVYHYGASKANNSNRICINSSFCYNESICGYPYYGRPDTLRESFYSELSSIGYPGNLRKIAIANGSGNAAGQSFNAGDKIISYYYTSWKVDILGDAWAIPNNLPVKKIFHGEIDPIGTGCDSSAKFFQSTNPYDSAPGGMRDSNKQIADSSAPYGDITTSHPNHCFIPTISALDINTIDLFRNIAYDPTIMDRTPFDAIYYPAENEPHVAITPENANWVMKEIMTIGCATSLGSIIEGLKVLTGIQIAEDPVCLDFYWDGKVDVKDIIKQLQYLSGLN